MRIAALLDPAADGLITDNGNVVGEITLGGSLQLLIFAGVFGGLVVGMVWIIVRDWLPRNRHLRIPVAGMTAATIGSFFVISHENPDFLILDPASANVAMFILLVGLTGSATALLDQLMEGRLPDGGRVGGVYAALVILGAVLALPVFVNFFFFLGASPPWPSGIFLALVAFATMLNWVHSYASNEIAGHLHKRVGTLGRFGVAGAVAFGALHLAGEIDSILASA